MYIVNRLEIATKVKEKFFDEMMIGDFLQLRAKALSIVGLLSYCLSRPITVKDCYDCVVKCELPHSLHLEVLAVISRATVAKTIIAVFENSTHCFCDEDEENATHGAYCSMGQRYLIEGVEIASRTRGLGRGCFWGDWTDYDSLEDIEKGPFKVLSC